MTSLQIAKECYNDAVAAYNKSNGQTPAEKIINYYSYEMPEGYLMKFIDGKIKLFDHNTDPYRNREDIEV